MGRFVRPDAVRRIGDRLVPVLDDAVAIPQLSVIMSGMRAVMKVGGVIMGDAQDVAGKYVAPGGLTTDPAAATDIRGVGGEPGSSIKGDAGASAWTPMLVIESDGPARYLKVVDWTGGTGAKPDTGYIGAAGVTTKANAPNLNAAKKFGIFSAVSNAQGIANVSFGTTFADAGTTPSIGYWAIPATAVGAIRATPVSGTLSKAGVQVKVEAPNLLSAVLSLLVGASVFVIAIEQ